MLCRVKFSIRDEDGSSAGSGSMVIEVESRSEIAALATDRLTVAGILRKNEGLELAVIELPEDVTKEQVVVANGLAAIGSQEKQEVYEDVSM